MALLEEPVEGIHEELRDFCCDSLAYEEKPMLASKVESTQEMISNSAQEAIY